MSGNDPPPILDYATPPGGRPISKIRRQAAAVFWSIGVGLFLFVPLTAGFFWFALLRDVGPIWVAWGVAIIGALGVAVGAAMRPLLRKLDRWEILAAGMSLGVLEPFVWAAALIKLEDVLSIEWLLVTSISLPVLAVASCWLALAFRGPAGVETEANPNLNLPDQRGGCAHRVSRNRLSMDFPGSVATMDCDARNGAAVAAVRHPAETPAAGS